MKGVTDNETVKEIRDEILSRTDLSWERKKELCNEVTERFNSNLDWACGGEIAKIWTEGFVGMGVQVGAAYIAIPGLGGAVDGLGEAIAEGKWNDWEYVRNKMSAGAAVDVATLGLGKLLGKAGEKLIKSDLFGNLAKRIQQRIPFEKEYTELSRKLIDPDKERSLYQLLDEVGKRYGELMQEFKDACKKLGIKGKGYSDLSADEITKLDELNPTLRRDLQNYADEIPKLKNQINEVYEEIDKFSAKLTVKYVEKSRKLVIDILQELSKINKKVDLDVLILRHELLRERLAKSAELNKFLDKYLIDKDKFLDALVKLITNLNVLADGQKSIDELITNTDEADLFWDAFWDFVLNFIWAIPDNIDFEQIFDDIKNDSASTESNEEQANQSTEGGNGDNKESIDPNDNHQTEGNNTGGNNNDENQCPVDNDNKSTPPSIDGGNGENQCPIDNDNKNKQTSEEDNSANQCPVDGNTTKPTDDDNGGEVDVDKILQEYFPELYPDNPNPSPEPKPTPPTPTNPNTPTVDNPNGGNQQGGQGSGGTKVNPLDPTYDPWGDVWDAMPDAVGDVCEKVLSEAEGYVGKQLDKLIAKYPGLQNVLNHIGIDGTGLVRGVVNIVGVLITAPDIGTAIGQLMDMAVNSLRQIATRLIQWGVQWLAEKLLGNLLVPQAVQWIEKTASNWLIGVATPVIDAGLDALRTQIEKCARCAGFKVAPTPPSPTTTKFVNGLINGNSGAGSNSSTFKSK